MDADLQDDPHEIPRFLAEMEKNFDVINGWKKVRHDPWHKVLPSRVFNWMVSALTGVKLHDHNCGMKCYRHQVLHEVRLYGELHRFVPVLAAARGFRVGEIAVNHRPRKFGRSKYGFSRFIKGFLDLLTVRFLTGFSQRPQHLLGTVGLASFVLGALGLTYLAGWWVVSRLAARLGARSSPREARRDLFDGAAAVGRTTDVDRFSGRVVHRLPCFRYSRLLGCRRTAALPARPALPTPAQDSTPSRP